VLENGNTSILISNNVSIYDMDILQYLILALIALSSFPIGLIVSKYTRDEIKKGRNEILAVAILSGLAILLSFFLSAGERAVAITAAVFLIILCSVSLRKV